MSPRTKAPPRPAAPPPPKAEEIFENWWTEHQEEIELVQLHLNDPLSDNPADLGKQLRLGEASHSRMTKLLADANAFLDIAERNSLLKVITEGRFTQAGDKKIMIASGVVDQRRFRDILKGIVDSIKNRSILGMNLRNGNAGERTNW